jgi:hypothetical protein
MTGLWVMVILLILAISELTFLVHHFTRFCEEVFTGVVAVFFIYEACLSIFHVRAAVMAIDSWGSNKTTPKAMPSSGS